MNSICENTMPIPTSGSGLQQQGNFLDSIGNFLEGAVDFIDRNLENIVNVRDIIRGDSDVLNADGNSYPGTTRPTGPVGIPMETILLIGGIALAVYFLKN